MAHDLHLGLFNTSYYLYFYCSQALVMGAVPIIESSIAVAGLSVFGMVLQLTARVMAMAEAKVKADLE